MIKNKKTQKKYDKSSPLLQPLEDLKNGIDKKGTRYLTDCLCDFYDYLARKESSVKRTKLFQEKLESLLEHAENKSLDITPQRTTYQSFLREYPKLLNPKTPKETTEISKKHSSKEPLTNRYIPCEVVTPPEMMPQGGGFY